MQYNRLHRIVRTYILQSTDYTQIFDIVTRRGYFIHFAFIEPFEKFYKTKGKSNGINLAPFMDIVCIGYTCALQRTKQANEMEAAAISMSWSSRTENKIELLWTNKQTPILSVKRYYICPCPFGWRARAYQTSSMLNTKNETDRQEFVCRFFVAVFVDSGTGICVFVYVSCRMRILLI